jgi:uncharacterized surface protein with fasciclin (FAS1) repeats
LAQQSLKGLIMKSMLLATLLMCSFSASGYADAKKMAAAPALDIVDTAVGAGQFSTLAAALTAADLVATLKGAGPFTVFAPTDAAFNKLPKGTLEKLLKPENKATLAKILTYHVVGSQVLAADVKAGAVTSVQGGALNITTKNGVKINGTATVTKTDIKASNGVIHVIDAVLLPADVKL